jgi:hypothetical protein
VHRIDAYYITFLILNVSAEWRTLQASTCSGSPGVPQGADKPYAQHVTCTLVHCAFTQNFVPYDVIFALAASAFHSRKILAHERALGRH